MIEYRDPLYGYMNIDLESDEYPKSLLYLIFCGCIILFLALGALCAFLAVFLSIARDSWDFLLILGGGALVSCGIAGGLSFLARKTKKRYYAIREEILQTKAPKKRNVKIAEAHITIECVEVGTCDQKWIRGVDSSNSDSPVTVKITFTNHLKKPIKYVNFTLTPYNAVDDEVECTVTGECTCLLSCPGPYLCEKTYDTIMDDGWYNTTIQQVKVEEIEVVYTDGTGEVLDDAQIEFAPHRKLMGDNASRAGKQSLGSLFMVLSVILDLVAIIGFIAMPSALFALVLGLGTLAFFVGSSLRR